jgi:hypothetical protein
MAVGLPAKTTYADGDVFSASDINDTNGTINLFQTSTLSSSSGKNFVINGGYDIWQRGTSGTANGSSAGAGYNADRWQNAAVGNAITVSRQATSDTTNLPFIQYCARVQRNSGQTGTGIFYHTQSIETINSIPLVGKIVTVSFYARKGANYSSASSALGFQLQTGTGTDQNIFGMTGAGFAINSSATLTTTWQRFTFTTASAIATSVTELGLVFSYTPSGTAGAADYYEVTGVQMELGSYATTFARNGATIQGELSACQRYYQRYNTLVAYGSLGITAGAVNSVTTYAYRPLITQMRAAATSIDYGGNLNLVTANDVGTAVTSMTLASAETNTQALGIYINVASGLTTNNFYKVNGSNDTTAYIGCSAEL